jgi:hypothetical protein
VASGWLDVRSNSSVLVCTYMNSFDAVLKLNARFDVGNKIEVRFALKCRIVILKFT